MTARLSLTGREFGRLRVLEFSASIRGATRWHCECACGVRLTIRGANLTSGNTKSCGCLHREIAVHCGKATVQHGEGTGTAEYRAWHGMKARCLNPNDKDYPNYGGRGIKVCDRWLSEYPTFLADMGRRPTDDHTLDRFPDNDGNYEPGNCRWATRRQQANNRRPKSKRTSA